MADWHLWLPPALTKPRFRLYAAGHTVAVIGAWIQQVAISWLVFRLSGSVVLLGITGFLMNIFYLLLGPFAGLTADRLPRLKFLIAIDLFLAACAALLAVMAATGVTSIPAYLVIAALIGAANAFEMPVRQTLMRDIVEERALITSALGVSAMVFNVGRLIGPAIAGLVLAYLSEAWCFLLNALSYAGIIVALIAMRLPPQAPRLAPTGAASAGASSRRLERPLRVSGRALPAADGGRHRPVRHALRAADALDRRRLLRRPVLHPRPAHELGRGGRARGCRLSCRCSRAMAASCACRRWRRSPSASRWRCLPGRACCPPRACCSPSWAGAAMLGVNATNAMLQQSVPDEWRGRVIGIYSMSFAGTAPLGGLLSGWLAEHIGLTATLTLNGLHHRRRRACWGAGACTTTPGPCAAL